MKEKINEYSIDQPLTPERRKQVEGFITLNAEKLGRQVVQHWNEAGNVLSLASEPVEWEFVFRPGIVEAYGSAPFWLKMLFTDSRRAMVDKLVMQMLHEAGFINEPGGGEK